jgi:hypothetical protein
LSTTNPTWIDPGSNPGLRGGGGFEFLRASRQRRENLPYARNITTDFIVHGIFLMKILRQPICKRCGNLVLTSNFLQPVPVTGKETVRDFVVKSWRKRRKFSSAEPAREN